MDTAGQAFIRLKEKSLTNDNPRKEGLYMYLGIGGIVLLIIILWVLFGH